MDIFFEKFNSIGDISPKLMSDSLSVGLGWHGSGVNAPERFAARVEKYLPEFITAWNNGYDRGDLFGILRAVERFIVRMNTIDTVDSDMPLYRGNKNIKNSFSYVKILRSLARILAGPESAEEFLFLISSDGSSPNRFLFLTARAQLLLAKGEFRKAADIARQAKHLRANDLCLNKTFYATQEALFENGMVPDIDHNFICKDKLFCEQPFTILNIHSRTDADDLVYGLCHCRGWSPMVFEFNKDSHWNSEEAQEMRRSILDGSFKYCDKLNCPKLAGDRLPKSCDVDKPFLRNIIDNKLTELSVGPERLILAYDRSCNLSCPSCRSRVYMADSNTAKSFDKSLCNFVDSMLQDVQMLQMTQTGEALASAHFRRLLKTISPSKYPNLKINLMTNAKLLSKRTWKKIGPGAECIDTLIMSIDGATPKTLEKLRRGLSWKKLIRALEFAKELRTSSKISEINVVFVAQKDNFREIPEMLELCSQYCCDNLTVAPLVSHGAYTKEEFMEINVYDFQHPLRPEYKEIQQVTLLLQDQMRKNEKKLLAQGRSMPTVMFR